MIGKLSGVCPIKLPFKIFLLSALDSLASLYLFFWRKKKKKRKNFLAAGVQTEVPNLSCPQQQTQGILL